MIIETVKFNGVFTTYDNPGYSKEELINFYKAGFLLKDIPGLYEIQKKTNVLMAGQKAKMVSSVYPNVDKLVITSQTTTPVDTETSFSGEIYRTVASDEFARSASTANPYQILWLITSSSANGAWGSFVLIESDDTIINRSLAGITKTAGQSILVDFTGTITE